MKKWMYLFAMAALVTGCSSVETHNGRNSAAWQDAPRVHLVPLEAEVQIEQPISGVAECQTWFGFLTKQPAKQTYGTEFIVPSGNFAPDQCSRGAVYDALSKNNAEVIVAPRYTTIQHRHLCLFGRCVHRTSQTVVSGYKGKIVNYRNIEEDARKVAAIEAVKSQVKQAEKKHSLLGFLGL